MINLKKVKSFHVQFCENEEKRKNEIRKHPPLLREAARGRMGPVTVYLSTAYMGQKEI